jgi:glycosyltransferase involved in cell wall biosynthesis
MADTRVAYVYPNSRRELIADCRAGTAPDTHLLGLTEVGRFGVDAEVREPALDTHAAFLPHRLRWHLRELTLPWELRDFDLIFTPLANLVPLASGVRRRPPVLVYNFGFNTILRRAGRARRALLAAALRHTAGVVCLGPSQRDELLALTDLDPDRVPVAIHGVDDHFFAAGRAQRERLVVAVGKDLARDYATLVQVARAIDARFVFVVLRRNVEGLVLPPNVETRERISYVELRDLYQRAACAVVALRKAEYPFGSEGSGVTALLEAKASATPLVATDRPIIRDYLRHDETALIVEEENADALRAGIERILDDSAHAEALARAGRRRVEERHTMNDMAAALAPLMKAAASQK